MGLDLCSPYATHPTQLSDLPGMSLTQATLLSDFDTLCSNPALLSRFLPPTANSTSTVVPAAAQDASPDLDQTVQALAAPPTDTHTAVALSRDYVWAMRTYAAELGSAGSQGPVRDAGAGAGGAAGQAQGVHRLEERIERVRDQAEELKKAVESVEASD